MVHNTQNVEAFCLTSLLHPATPCHTLLHPATPCYTPATPCYTPIHPATPCYTLLHPCYIPTYVPVICEWLFTGTDQICSFQVLHVRIHTLSCSHVKDIHDVLTITVYSGDSTRGSEFVGTVAIPLLRVSR